MNKTYYAIQREIFRENGLKPIEVVNYPNLFATEEEAVRFARKDQDSDSLFYGYTITKQPLVSLEERKSSKNNKTVIYRHEYNVIAYKLEEA